MRNIQKIVASAIAVPFSLSIVPQVFADESADDITLLSCPEVGQTSVTATVINSNYHIGVGQIFRSGPGGTITASTTSSYSVGVTSNVSGGITAGEIVQAAVNAGFSNSATYSSSTSYQYSRDVTPGRYGNMQYGNYGAQVNVRKTTIVAPCNVKVLASGNAVVPSRNVWGYRYWES